MHKKEKVLLTGANGLLGVNIAKQLIIHGYHVKAMVRPGGNLENLRNLGCETFEGLVTNFYDLEEAVKCCYYIIHCASRTKQYPTKLKVYTRANIDSTAFLIELCKKLAVKRLIYVSTANSFTPGSLKRPGNEKSNFMPWLRNSGYAYSKYIAQQMVLNEAINGNINAVVVAPTFIIGQMDSKPSSGQMLLYAAKNKVVFVPPGGKSFVDAENASLAIVNSLIKGRSGECYLISGENISYINFFRLVAKVYHKKKFMVPLPKILLVAVALVSSILEKIFRISLPLNMVNQRLLCLDNYFSNKKAQIELGMQHTSIEHSIHKSLAWFTENGYLK